MRKELSNVLVAVVLLVTMFATTGTTRSKLANLADKMRGYSFESVRERTERQMLTPEMENQLQSSNSSDSRSSLGTAALHSSVASPGLRVKNTHDDWQWSHNRRRVDFRGTPDVHFAYTDQSVDQISAVGVGVNEVFGYNVYDPVLGNWPQGIDVGCKIQNADGTERGIYPNLDVNPEGLILIGGHIDLTAQTAFDNQFYYQGSQFGCFFGAGALIPNSQYTPGFAAPATSRMNHPAIEVQVIGGDTVQHVLGHESAAVAVLSAANGATGFVMQYFRKVGWGPAGSFTGPTTIGAGQYRGSLMSSRASAKVAVAWVAPSPRGLTDVNSLASVENDIYIKESTDGGVTWPTTATNITNYDRSVPSLAPWIETNGLYDSQDGLHVIWNGNPLPADVYNVAGFFFNDFSADLYHWSDRNPAALSRIMSADHGIAANTVVCGFAGFNMLYMGFFNISECDGSLYSIWSEIHHGFDVNDPTATDDCTQLAGSYGSGQRFHATNKEIRMSVSSGLDGLLWDASRNVTNSATPLCDSAIALGGNGICMDDTRSSLSRYGMDEAAMTATFGTLTWPGTERLDLSPGQNYAGNHYLQMFYLEDHIPGNGTLDGAGAPEVSNNSLNWIRLACVDPITAPSISLSDQSLGYPDFTQHGMQEDVTITVRNDGNTGLNISSIQSIEDSGPTGWLSTSVTSLMISAGASNTATFDVNINVGGIVNSAGTIVSLPGRVRITSDAPAPNDIVDIEISYIVADTVIGIITDTVNTGTVALAVSNHGNMGASGSGGVNLDYTAAGTANPDCDPTQTVYMFGGSPFIIQEITAGTSYKFSNSFGQAGFAANFAFKPVGDLKPSSSTPTAAYDHFFSGTFVNSDTTIGIEREFYAPLGGAPDDDFVLVKTKFFSIDGSEQTGLLLGDQIDWDVPTDAGATNVSGIVGKTVYQQGIDTGAVLTGCQPFANRYAGSTFLGMYTTTEFLGDACANNTDRWGVYAARNDSDIFVSPNGVMDSARVWAKAGALQGEWADTSSTDLHIVQSYVYDYTLAAGETLTVYTAMATILNGSATDLSDNVKAACAWYNDNLRPGCVVCSCCKGATGNIDNDPGDFVDIADLTFLIDHLFINFPLLACREEGNIDGDPNGDVDIADLTFLIDHLFINFPLTSDCQ